jgi:TP901 family phage tail tape measure protein
MPSPSQIGVQILISARDQATAVFNRVAAVVKEIGAKAAIISAAAGAAFTGLFASSVGEAADFEKALDLVASKASFTADEMDALRQAALEAGSTTAYNASQAAEGLKILVSAGLSANEAIATLSPTLNVAAIEGLELADAASILTNTAGQMGIAMTDSARIANVLARGAQLSNTSVADLGEALKAAGGMAAASGMSLEETVAVLDAFATKGLKGSEAGTALRNILGMLSQPAHASRVELAKLGDASGDLMQMVQTLSENSDTSAAAITAFGAEVTAALLGLQADGLPAIDAFKSQLESVDDTARKSAQTTTENFQGYVTAMSSAWSGLKITLGTPILEPLSKAVQSLTGKISELTNTEQFQAFADKIAVKAEQLRESLSMKLDSMGWDGIEQMLGRVGARFSSVTNMAMATYKGFEAVVNSIGVMVAHIASGIATVTAYALDGLNALDIVSDETARNAHIAAESLMDASAQYKDAAQQSLSEAIEYSVAAADALERGFGNVETQADRAAKAIQSMSKAPEQIDAGMASAFESLELATQQYTDAMMDFNAGGSTTSETLDFLKSRLEDVREEYELVKASQDALLATQKAEQEQWAAVAKAITDYNGLLIDASNGDADAALAIEKRRDALVGMTASVYESTRSVDELTTMQQTLANTYSELSGEQTVNKDALAQLKLHYDAVTQAIGLSTAEKTKASAASSEESGLIEITKTKLDQLAIARERDQALAEGDLTKAQQLGIQYAELGTKIYNLTTDYTAAGAGAAGFADETQAAVTKAQTSLVELKKSLGEALLAGDLDLAGSIREQIAGVEQELETLQSRLQKTSGESDTFAKDVAAAFQGLQVTSKDQFKNLADAAAESFSVIERAGQNGMATTRDVESAFVKYAKARLAEMALMDDADRQSADTQLKTKAASLGLAETYRDMSKDVVGLTEEQKKLAAQKTALIDSTQKEADAAAGLLKMDAELLRSKASIAQASGDTATASTLNAQATVKESESAVVLARAALEAARAKEEQARATVDATGGTDQSAIAALSEAEANTKLAQSSVTVAETKQKAAVVEAKKVQTTKEGTEATEENTESTEENTEAVSGAASVMEAWARVWQSAINNIKDDSPGIARAVQAIFDSYDTFYNKIGRINNLNVYEAFTNSEAQEAQATIEALRVEADALRESAGALEMRGMLAGDWKPAYDMLAAIQRANSAAAKLKAEQLRVAESTRLANEEFKQLQLQLEAGEISAVDYARSVDWLRTKFGQITDEGMRNFKAELISTKEKMQDFTDSATDGLKDVRAEWAELNNQKMDALIIEQQIERLEIEKEIIDAEKDGNADAVRALKEKLRITGQIQDVQRQQLAEEQAAAQIESVRAEREEEARRKALSETERDYEDTIANLTVQLKQAYMEQDVAAQESLTKKIRDEEMRFTKAIDNQQKEEEAATKTSSTRINNTSTEAYVEDTRHSKKMSNLDRESGMISVGKTGAASAIKNEMQLEDSRHKQRINNMEKEQSAAEQINTTTPQVLPVRTVRITIDNKAGGTSGTFDVQEMEEEIVIKVLKALEQSGSMTVI